MIQYAIQRSIHSMLRCYITMLHYMSRDYVPTNYKGTIPYIIHFWSPYQACDKFYYCTTLAQCESGKLITLLTDKRYDFLLQLYKLIILRARRRARGPACAASVISVLISVSKTPQFLNCYLPLLAVFRLSLLEHPFNIYNLGLVI